MSGHNLWNLRRCVLLGLSCFHPGKAWRFLGPLFRLHLKPRATLKLTSKLVFAVVVRFYARTNLHSILSY